MVAGYNFRITDPASPAIYHDTVAKAYIELRTELSRLLAQDGQISTQRMLPFIAPSNAAQVLAPTLGSSKRFRN